MRSCTLISFRPSLAFRALDLLLREVDQLALLSRLFRCLLSAWARDSISFVPYFICSSLTKCRCRLYLFSYCLALLLLSLQHTISRFIHLFSRKLFPRIRPRLQRNDSYLLHTPVTDSFDQNPLQFSPQNPPRYVRLAFENNGKHLIDSPIRQG
jgi:hypothetical protein